MFLMGGAENPEDPFMDVWGLSLSLQAKEWVRIPCIGDTPPALTNASLSFIAESLVLVGGSNRGSGASSNSVYRFFPSNNQWANLKLRGFIPRARNSHTAVVSGGNLYVFGGWNEGEFFDDIHALHSHCTAWSQILPSSSARPCGRMGHSCSVYRNSMFVFGGFNHPHTLQDLWEFNFALSRWEELPPVGLPPRDRYRHSSVVLGDRLVVFGGMNSQRERFNDVHVYEITRRCWFKLDVGNNIPSPRSFHQAVALGDEMYIIGGVGEAEKLSDVWKFFSRFNRVESEKLTDATGWQQLAASGLEPRTGHVACMSDRKIFVFGGQREEGSIISDLQMFDLDLREWSTESTAAITECSRSGAKAVLCEDAFVVFGGSSSGKRNGYLNDMNVYWLSRGEWERLDNKGLAPSSRTDHALASVCGDIVLYGGTNRKSIFGDTFRFASDGSGWEEIVGGTNPPGRFGHSGISWENHMVVFGGWNGSQLLDEVWSFSLKSKIWKLATKGAGKGCSRRYRHSASSTGDFMFVFGGVDSDQNRLNDLWSFNLNRGEWTEVLCGPNVRPSPRTFHQTIIAGEFLYVVGGRGEKKLGDVWRIRLMDQENPGESSHIQMGSELDRLRARVAQIEARITCKVCMEAEINCVLIPCTHRCVCLACAAVIVNRECLCPICRETILRLVETIDA